MRVLMIAVALTIATGVAAQAAGKSCPAFTSPVRSGWKGLLMSKTATCRLSLASPFASKA